MHTYMHSYLYLLFGLLSKALHKDFCLEYVLFSAAGCIHILLSTHENYTKLLSLYLGNAVFCYHALAQCIVRSTPHGGQGGGFGLRNAKPIVA